MRASAVRLWDPADCRALRGGAGLLEPRSWYSQEGKAGSCWGQRFSQGQEKTLGLAPSRAGAPRKHSCQAWTPRSRGEETTGAIPLLSSLSFSFPQFPLPTVLGAWQDPV